jgi:hypothetical protein
MSNGMPDAARRTVTTAVRKIQALALAAGNAEEIQAALIVCERALSTLELEYTEPEAAEVVATEAKKDLLM